MATLFECAILINEKRDSNNNIVEPAVLVTPEPFYLVAASQSQATLLAGKQVPDEVMNDAEKFDRAVIIVRPF